MEDKAGFQSEPDQ